MVMIDTHALIWALYEPERLSLAAAHAISAQPCLVSVVSLWEMSIKAGKGQLILRDSIIDIARKCLRMNVSILAVTPEHCQRLQSLPPFHKDPFDRMIITQAMVEGVPLVTKDENIWKGYDALEKIW